jgi:hypothetical protein
LVGSGHRWTRSWRTTRPTPTLPTAASRRPPPPAPRRFRKPRPFFPRLPSTSSSPPTS